MATIFKNGWWSMGFDMSPTGANVFNGGGSSAPNVGNSGAVGNTPYLQGLSWALLNQFSLINLGTNLATLWTGFWVKLPSLPGTNQRILAWYDLSTTTIQCNLRVYSDGHFELCSGSGTTRITGTSASATGLIVANTWCHIQTKITIDPSAGVFQLVINDSGSHTTAISGTGLNTRTSANSWVSQLELNSVVTTGNTFYDDWWMLDNSGSSPFNGFLGIIQVQGDKPSANSAVGGRNAYTPSNPQNDNHLNVGNIPATTAQFNSDNSTGDYDMFRFPSLSSAASVLGLNVWVTIGQDAGGTHTIGIDCYSGGTDAISSAITPAAITTPSFVNQTFNVDPNTSAAWTPTNAGNAELGVKTLS